MDEHTTLVKVLQENWPLKMLITGSQALLLWALYLLLRSWR